MNKTILDTRIQEYLSYRRGLGYRMTNHEDTLRRFVRFVSRRRYRGVLKRDWVEAFADTLNNATAAYCRSQHTIIRDFARYWAARDPRVEVPAPREPRIGYRRQEPYIYSEKEVHSLMKAARCGRRSRLLGSETYATVIGLMAATGLRTGEAADLGKNDVNLEQSLLYVRHGKNQRLRLIPIHDTTVRALQSYARRRDSFFPLPKSDHFFLNERGRPISTMSVDENFRRIRRRAGITVAAGRRQPRAYDLRHTFACNRLTFWLREGRDVSRSIHYLATYLGHEHIKYTYWYLTAVPALVEIVGTTFERYAAETLRRTFA